MRKLSAILGLALLVSCSSEEIVPEPYRPTDAWDGYRHGLETAGLTDTALGRDWADAAAAAVAAPVTIDLPYREDGYFDPSLAHAVGYRFSVDRGQRVEVQLELVDQPPARTFLDLYRHLEERALVHVATAAADQRRLAFEPRRAADYVLRLQPELLRGGRYVLTVRLVAALDFPVQGHDVTDIQSGFGAPRDGGRRSHHGVDIFAPRGTPVVATSRAWVRRIGEQRLGGNVVWLHDRERSLHLYFAHLETQEVEQGVWVEPGQIIGTVGNSGNARTTPTHLHFAVYARGEGPLDPRPFLARLRQSPPAVRAEGSLVGEWVVAAGGLRDKPNRRADLLAELAANTRMRIWAATGSYYRVILDDGSAGFVPASTVSLPATAPAAAAAE